MKDFIEKRLKEIDDAIVQTSSQYSALHGSKNELLNILKNSPSTEDKKEDVTTEEKTQV